ISTVTHMIDFVREEDIPVVFYLEFSNGKTANLIAEDTGAETTRFSSCHNVTKEEFEQGVTYISLMEQNLEALKGALA
ncbi:MAG: zinc ABC transporter substrate-binding protein, partial [Ruminococcus sp.]|nr:zinc ABC transporter substrate-binding protein [Ruminococcus sp.]